MSPNDPSLSITANAALLLARSIEEQTSQLIARQFQSRTPTDLALIIRAIATALAEKVPLLTDGKTLKLTSSFLKRLGIHLRYIDAAASGRIPSALISPLEKLVSKLFPNASVIMLRMQWSYNYTIFEILSKYRDALGDILTEEESSRLLSGRPKYIYIVSFPSIEYSNVLQHTILGHELGHTFADSYLKQEDWTALSASIMTRIGDASWYDREINRKRPLGRFAIKHALFQQIQNIRNRGLAEIICDLFGYYLFGPAFVFSLHEFSSHDSLDARPSADRYYPPWRFRLRELVKVMDADGIIDALRLPGESPLSHQVRTALQSRVESLRQIAQETKDMLAIEGDGVLKRAYDEIRRVLPNISGFVKQKLGRLAYSKSRLAKELPHLVAVLSIGVPPNRTETGIAGSRSVMNAGWLYRIARLPIPYKTDTQWKVDDDIILNRLILKAIEYVDVQEQFDRWQKRKKV